MRWKTEREAAQREARKLRETPDRIDPEGAVRQQQAELVATWTTAQARLSCAVTDRNGDRATVIAAHRDHCPPFKPSLRRRLGELRGLGAGARRGRAMRMCSFRARAAYMASSCPSCKQSFWLRVAMRAQGLNWRAALASSLAGLSGVRSVAGAVSGSVTAGTVTLPAAVELSGDTTIVARNIVAATGKAACATTRPGDRAAAAATAGSVAAGNAPSVPVRTTAGDRVRRGAAGCGGVRQADQVLALAAPATTSHLPVVLPIPAPGWVKRIPTPDWPADLDARMSPSGVTNQCVAGSLAPSTGMQLGHPAGTTRRCSATPSTSTALPWLRTSS